MNGDQDREKPQAAERLESPGPQLKEGMIGGTLYGQKRFDRKKLIRQVFVSVIISFASVVLIFFFLSRRGFSVDLSAFHPAWLIGGFGLMVGMWILDGTRVFINARAWQKRLRFRDALGTVLSGYFMSAITPFSSGGSPAQMFVLTRSGLTWGEAANLMVITGILYQCSLLLLLFTLVFVFRIGFTLRGFLLDLLYSFAVFYSALLLLLFYLLLCPRMLYRLINWGMGMIRRRFRRVKFSEEVVWTWVNEFMGDFRRGFKIFIIQKPQYLAWNLGCYLVQYMMMFSVAHLVLLSLGAFPPYLEIMGAQIPLFYVFSLIPSPGASGGAEISIASVFLRFVGAEKLGMFVLFWRFITFYFALLIGGMAFFFILKKHGK